MKMGVVPPDLLERLAPLASMEDISVANTPLVTPLVTPLTTPAPSPRTRHRYRNLVIAKFSNFLIPISLQPHGDNL